MDENEEKKIQQFLKSYINPDDDDIRNFVDSLATEHPSIDEEKLTQEIKERSQILSQQSAQLYKLEEVISDFSDLDSPDIADFKNILQRSFAKNSELEDVSHEIGTLEAKLENVNFNMSQLCISRITKPSDILIINY